MKYVFADEAGNFDFSRRGSRYFILATVTLDDCSIGNDLLDLRRQLATEGYDVPKMFHAKDDPWPRRRRVYGLINQRQIRVDATILEKRKAIPKVRVSEDGFYRYAWYYHLKFVGPRICGRTDEQVFVNAASLSTNARKGVFKNVVDNVASSVLQPGSCTVVSWESQTDPCLQVADYCTWAIQRWWEYRDDQARSMIMDKIHTEYDLWRRGTTMHY